MSPEADQINNFQPLSSRAREFFPAYGWSSEEIEAVGFPEIMETAGLLKRASERSAGFPDAGLIHAIGSEAITFADRHRTGHETCQMRPVVAAYLLKTEIDGRPQGFLAVCGINGLPPDHIEGTHFDHDETQGAIRRHLDYLVHTGRITAGGYDFLVPQIQKETEGQILSCVQISRKIREKTGLPVRSCRRRDVREPLPKSACPSILCAEGGALANQGIAKIVHSLVMDPHDRNLVVFPIPEVVHKDGGGRMVSRYRVYYQKTAEVGEAAGGMVYLDRQAAVTFSRLTPEAYYPMLRLVRKKLQPGAGQTGVNLSWQDGDQGRPEIVYFNPQAAEDRTDTFPLSPDLLEKEVSADIGKTLFKPVSMATTDIPCPRCVRLIRDQNIPSAAITGPMTLKPDYYEPACLYALTEVGIAVIHPDIR